MPAKMPSSRAIRRHMSSASSWLTETVSSMCSRHKFSACFLGHLRMPGMREPSDGCAPMIRMDGFFSFRKREKPVMVPVVPMALTKG